MGWTEPNIEYLHRNVTNVRMGIIAHGVNCQGAMGSGVALAIKEKWPEVYVAFKRAPTGKVMLGTAHLINVSDDDTLFVANCYTQLFYGKNGRFASPKAIEDSLHSVYQWGDYHHLDVYMPKIGAGLGGLSWKTEVEPVVRDVAGHWSRVNTYICEWP